MTNEPKDDAGSGQSPPSGDKPTADATIYDQVVHEWVARQLRGRGHKQYTSDMVRNVRLGIDEGFPGSDVTPADGFEAAIACEIRVADRKTGWWTDDEGWQTHYEHVFSVASFVRDCAEILEDLKKRDVRLDLAWRDGK